MLRTHDYTNACLVVPGQDEFAGRIRCNGRRARGHIRSAGEILSGRNLAYQTVTISGSTVCLWPGAGPRGRQLCARCSLSLPAGKRQVSRISGRPFRRCGVTVSIFWPPWDNSRTCGQLTPCRLKIFACSVHWPNAHQVTHSSARQLVSAARTTSPTQSTNARTVGDRWRFCGYSTDSGAAGAVQSASTCRSRPLRRWWRTM